MSRTVDRGLVTLKDSMPHINEVGLIKQEL